MPEILWDDFISGWPITEIFQSFDKQYMIEYIML
jgi:hypothetical protein